jgi:hypothetical protein
MDAVASAHVWVAAGLKSVRTVVGGLVEGDAAAAVVMRLAHRPDGRRGAPLLERLQLDCGPLN